MTQAEPDRKQDILDSAVDVILSDGLDGITIRKVADKAGVSTGLVLYYFGNRETLITQTWQLGLARLARRIFSQVGDVEGRDWWEAMMRVSFQDRGEDSVPWTFWLEFWALAARTPGLRQFHSDTYVQVRAHDASIARRAMELKQIRSDLDPELVADLYSTVVYGLAVKFVLDKETITGERAFEVGKFLLDLLSAEDTAADA